MKTKLKNRNIAKIELTLQRKDAGKARKQARAIQRAAKLYFVTLNDTKGN